MSEKTMLIVPSELTRKIDDNRGDMGRGEFIDFLIDGQLKADTKEQTHIIKEEIGSLKQELKTILLREDKEREYRYVTKEEIQSLQQNIKGEIEALTQDIKTVLLKEDKVREHKYVTKEEIQALQHDTKKLLKSFIDFFIGYGLEMGKPSPETDLNELAKKLGVGELEDDIASDNADDEGREVKIKWK